MASLEHQNYRSSSQFSKPNSLNLAIKLSASVFFFAVIFSCSSLLPLIFNLMEFFSCTIDKNYMFLLFNGILVLIVKNSGLIDSAHHEDNFYAEPTIKNGGRAQKVPELSDKKEELDEGGKFEAKVKEEEEETEDKSLVNVEAGEIVPLIREDGESKQGDENIIIIEEVEEEEATELLSAEELNKKCDDFIRRMKEGIKLEAQQLIMVQ